MLDKCLQTASIEDAAAHTGYPQERFYSGLYDEPLYLHQDGKGSFVSVNIQVFHWNSSGALCDLLIPGATQSF